MGCSLVPIPRSLPGSRALVSQARRPPHARVRGRAARPDKRRRTLPKSLAGWLQQPDGRISGGGSTTHTASLLRSFLSLLHIIIP